MSSLHSSESLSPHPSIASLQADFSEFENFIQSSENLLSSDNVPVGELEAFVRKSENVLKGDFANLVRASTQEGASLQSSPSINRQRSRSTSIPKSKSPLRGESFQRPYSRQGSFRKNVRPFAIKYKTRITIRKRNTETRKIQEPTVRLTLPKSLSQRKTETSKTQTDEIPSILSWNGSMPSLDLKENLKV